MSILWKILILLGIWMVFGFVAMIIDVVCWFSKTKELNSDNSSDLVDEMLDLATLNLYDFKHGEDFKDRIDKIEKSGGRSIFENLVLASITWPKQMAIIQSRYQEAYEIMRKKYGLKPEKINDDNKAP